MNVVLLTGQWLRTKGGPTNYVLNLSRALRRQGATITVLAAEPGEGAVEYGSSLISRNLDIIRALKEISPAVVHVHSRLHLIPPVLAYRWLTGKSCRLVFTFHTQPSLRRYLKTSEPIPPSYSGLRGILARMFLRCCDGITAVSDSIIRELNAHFDLRIRHYTVVPSGSGDVTAGPSNVAAFREAHDIADLDPIFATVGVFSWDWKVAGHQVAIEALARLREKHPSAGLLIAGDGRYRTYLEKLVDHLDLRRNVRFLGSVERPNEVLAVADIYIHMAMNEGSPLAVVEAMAAGKPIIASNLGGIPEIIEDRVSGVLIDARADLLASEVEVLLRDREAAARLGSNARSRARSELTWEAIARRYLNLYQSLGPVEEPEDSPHAVARD